MSQPGSLCVLQRSERPCCSNQCVFHEDGLPHIVFCAHAVDGGTIVVQQVSAGFRRVTRCRSSAASSLQVLLHN